jgi:predicted metal-dependent phosphoesterase TrpH
MKDARLIKALAAAIAAACLSAGLPAAEGLWVKGNTHAHTTLSDGNAPPAQVVNWYKDHGYQFVVLTDHDKVAPATFFDDFTDATFVVIPGMELSIIRERGRFCVHLNAIGIAGPLEPLVGSTAAEALPPNLDLIARTGAVAQLNHPSFHLRDLSAVKKLSGTILIEVYNHSSQADTYALVEQPAFEYAWEAALSAGKRAYAVASDDAHDYRIFGEKRANPGGGWIMVHVARLTREEILKNMAAGNFYASTGVEVDRCALEGGALRVGVKPVAGTSYTIQFIGKGGRSLAVIPGPSAEYHFRGGPREAYVRARISASNGAMAWLQPVWQRPPEGGKNQ